ncbi:MAG: hypothetical protein IKK66_06355 [Ruminococcus sp.]|nr:hypothetical protein [Ruminococcus sp.]
MSELSCCGTKCNECSYLGNLCKGCNDCNGKVFFMPDNQSCLIYECAINQKKLKNCAQCSELPCKIWMSTRDPKFTDDEFNKSVASRVQALKEMEK